ncbi:hypothetical protein ACFW4K_11395 [Nocardiopsis alba]|uniref:hypothetical protein n=1 Tax=Nocardiopsis alba TaxID=53437 RepID=UPI00367247D6
MPIIMLAGSLVTDLLLWILALVLAAVARSTPPDRRGPAIAGALLFGLGPLIDVLRLGLNTILIGRIPEPLLALLGVMSALCILGGLTLLGVAAAKPVREGR